MSALREIIAHFGVSFDDTALKKGTGALENTIASVKNFAGALGSGLALKAVWDFVTGLTEQADALAKQSAALGMSLSEMQAWNHAASMQGVSVDLLASSLAKLAGGKYDAKALAALGVSAKDASGNMKTAPDLLEDVAQGLSKIEDPTKRNTLAMGVLGKSYLKLMPLLQDGAKGIEDLRKEFDELGGGFSDDFASQSDEFGDNVDRIKLLWKSLAITVIGSVLPAMVSLTQSLLGVIKPLIVVLRHSQALKTMATALGAKALVVLSKAIGPLGTAFRALSGHILRTILPLLVLEDIFTFLSGGDSLIGRALEKWFGAGTGDKIRLWLQLVKTEFLAFVASVKSGQIVDDLKLIAKTLGDAFPWIRLWVTQGFNVIVFWIERAWSALLLMYAILGNVKDQGVTAFSLIAAHVALLIAAAGALGTAFAVVVNVIGGAFTGMWNGVLSEAQNVFAQIQKAATAVGASDMASKIGGVIASLEGSKGAGGGLSRLSASLGQDTLGGGVAYGGVASSDPRNFANKTEINVTVPAGTPAEVANRIGAAASAGSNKGLRAAHAALTPGQG